MQLSYKLLHVALFGAGAFGAVANWGASKLNQYKTIEDCWADRDIISHAAPGAESCHMLDPEAGALFYVASHHYFGCYYTTFSGTDCLKGYIEDQAGMEQGVCTIRNPEVHSMALGM